MVSELWMTSAYNIASRATWLSGALPGRDATGIPAMHEWQRMWSEKLFAAMEVGLEMQRAGYDLALGRFNPWHSTARVVRPLHRRTLSNSRRLARRDRAGG